MCVVQYLVDVCLFKAEKVNHFLLKSLSQLFYYLEQIDKIIDTAVNGAKGPGNRRTSGKEVAKVVKDGLESPSKSAGIVASLLVGVKSLMESVRLCFLNRIYFRHHSETVMKHINDRMFGGDRVAVYSDKTIVDFDHIYGIETIKIRNGGHEIDGLKYIATNYFKDEFVSYV
jgi:hypothetical protein